MKNKENLAGFRETVRSTLRAYKLWHQYAPRLILSSILYSISYAFTPYVTIYFSSQVLNELAGARDPERLLWLVGLTVSLTAALGALTALLDRWYRTTACGLGIWYISRQMETDKLLSMDFSAADDPHTHQLLSKMHEAFNWGG